MSYLLKTFTKSEYQITDEQESNIRKLGINDNININGSMIKASNIAEIVKVKEDIPQYKALPEYKPNFTKDRHIRALEQMIIGFKRHFKGRELPLQSKEMLKRMETGLDLAQQAPEDKKFYNPVKLFGVN